MQFLAAMRTANPALWVHLLLQDAYQQTHPVLFSDRAIYVILYSLRTGASPGDLSRHLMNVSLRHKEAPIILVGTHADVVHGGSGLSLAALKKRFPQVGSWLPSPGRPPPHPLHAVSKVLCVHASVYR
jgi:hypothetical protein